MDLLNALGSVLSIALMLGAGYFAAYKNWLSDDAAVFISKVVVNIALPCNMIHKITSAYTREQLFEYRYMMIIPFITMILCYGVGMLAARLVKIEPYRRGTFAAMFAMSNTIFMGLPVNLALFGASSEPMVYLYYMANSVLFWTFAINGIIKDGLVRGSAKAKTSAVENIKKIFNGGLIGILGGIIFVCIDVKIPVFIDDTMKYLGSLVTPLPMMFIGSIIYKTDWSKFRFIKDIPLLIIGRFVISPLIVLFVVMTAGVVTQIEAMAANVFIIQAAMPVMSQIPLLAKTYGADDEYAAIITTVTTLLSLIVIPLIKVML